jgi:hypothetical protein
MNRELDKKLVEKYPLIFRDRHGNIKETAMCWGFDCGDGWYNILDKLCADIQAYCDYHYPNVHQVIAMQVKEKFGGLRFYIYGGDDYIDKLISNAEEESYRTCEITGKPGKLRDTGWMKTLCDEKAKELGYEYDETISN